MYSERDTKTSKTRTIGISILMLISVVTPLATTVSANHDQPEPLALEMLDGNGTWVEVPEDSDPMIDGFMESGTYEFRFTSNNLTTNDDYALEWMVEVCQFDEVCSEEVSENRSWIATGTSSTETWNLTLGVMDCDVYIFANLDNETSGDSWFSEWTIYGPCGNTGDITLEVDLDGDGIDESVEGFNFSQAPSLDAGEYNASFGISNLNATGSYSLMWAYWGEESWEEGNASWNGSSPGSQLDFVIEIQSYTCSIWVQAILYDETAGESISAFVTMMEGPCVQPISVSIYDNATGEWVELSTAEPEASYPDCYWSSEDTRWWCGEDYDGDGELDETEDWWYYCEPSEYGWHCTDEFGQSEDHEFTQNNTLLVPVMLEVGTYDAVINITALNSTNHYAAALGHLNPEYVEFNTTSENYSIWAELPVSQTDCDEWFSVMVWDDPNNAWWEYPTLMGHFGYMGPCEQPPSPFTLTYDGVEWEQVWNYDYFDECEDMGDGYECWNDDWDYDGDGEPDWTEWFEMCEEDSDGNWECATWWSNPFIEAGNHTMELTIEDLEVGANYTIDIEMNICENMAGCDYDWMEMGFTATSENMSETFHLEIDNYTCSVNIHVSLHVQHEGGWSDWVAGDHFGFHGPCEQPPSPFTLTYDGVE
ncbi:MAG: hypothetical protein VW878_06920, partial [Candidatus Poseidoniales archaeon]